jgi:hypothetical protein
MRLPNALCSVVRLVEQACRALVELGEPSIIAKAPIFQQVFCYSYDLKAVFPLHLGLSFRTCLDKLCQATFPGKRFCFRSPDSGGRVLPQAFKRPIELGVEIQIGHSNVKQQRM